MAVLSLAFAEEYRLSEVPWQDGLSKGFGLLKGTHHTGTKTPRSGGHAYLNK